MRRGLTLVEMMIAASLGVLIMAAVAGFSFYMAKLSKSTTSQLKFFHYAKRAIWQMGQTIRYAKRIQVIDGGNRLECVDERDVTSAIYYSDEDGNPLTLSNNRIYWIRNVDAEGATPRAIASYVSPVAGKPIFAYQDRTSAVEINFRLGDPTANPHALFQRETGPGPQGLTINTAIGPRNSYLD